jgi:LemA protein
VRNLNVMVESVPSNIVAALFGFRSARYFQIEEAGDRAVPAVSLN